MYFKIYILNIDYMMKIDRGRCAVLTSGPTDTLTHECEIVYTHIYHTHPRNEKNIHHTAVSLGSEQGIHR